MDTFVNYNCFRRKITISSLTLLLKCDFITFKKIILPRCPANLVQQPCPLLAIFKMAGAQEKTLVLAGHVFPRILVVRTQAAIFPMVESNRKGLVKSYWRNTFVDVAIVLPQIINKITF